METLDSLVMPDEAPRLIVDRLRPGELEPAARILSRSFLGEPLFAHVFEGAESEASARALRPWFRTWIRTYAAGGHIHTARRGGELVGVAIRMAPGEYHLTGIRSIAFTARLVASVLRMGLTSRRAFQMPKVGGAITSREPRQPFWHLAWIGVDPDHQRTGIGSALADEAIRVIDERPALAWLITFGLHTRAIYEQRGFTVEGEIQPCPGGPIGWTMRREP